MSEKTRPVFKEYRAFKRPDGSVMHTITYTWFTTHGTSTHHIMVVDNPDYLAETLPQMEAYWEKT